MYFEYVLSALVCLIKVVELKLLETDVIILGAGASGISAAQTLDNKGIHDFLIVDAQAFVGGKISMRHTIVLAS